MSWAFVLLFSAACAVVAFAASALVGAALVITDRAVSRVDAVGRARLWLVYAAVPLVASTLVVVGAFGPFLGLTPDHCATHLAAHAHLCFGHPLETTSPLLIIPASILAARLASRGLRCISAVWRAHGVRRELCRTAVTTIGETTVLPLSEPIAFVIGWLEPVLFVSTGLLSRPGDEVAAVLAHERAHAARLDPLRRLSANLLLAFHLPGIADALERRLGVTQEMAADACAADELGDPIRVAETLVAVARAGTADVPGCDRHGTTISLRVLELLRESRPVRRLPMGAFATAFAAFILVATGSAGTVHHLLEHVLSFLGA